MKNTITFTKKDGLTGSVFAITDANRKNFDSVESLTIIMDGNTHLQAIVTNSEGNETTVFGANAISFHMENSADDAFNKLAGDNQFNTAPRASYHYTSSYIPDVHVRATRTTYNSDLVRFHQDHDTIVIIGPHMRLAGVSLMPELEDTTA